MKSICKTILGVGRFSTVIGLSTLLLLSCAVSKPLFQKTPPELPDDPYVDRSLISGQPCEAPCWYGLKLGESSILDVRSTLQSLPFVNHSGVLEQPINNGNPNQKIFIFSCVYLTYEYDCGSLETSSDGKLEKIYLSVLYPLTIQTLIDKLGAPEYYSVFGPSPNLSGCLIYIYWPQKNIYAQISDYPGNELCKNFKSANIVLNLQIDAIRYEMLSVQEIQDSSLPWSDIIP